MLIRLKSLRWNHGFVYAGDVRLKTHLLKKTQGCDLFNVYDVRGQTIVFVVKRFKRGNEGEYETEQCMIDKIRQAQLTCFVRAFAMNESSIAMDAYEGDCSQLEWGNVSTGEIETMVKRWRDDLQSMVDHGLYYTDCKWNNILYSTTRSDGVLDTKWCDLGSLSIHDWTCQTFPYPGRYDYHNYDATIEPASEKVVVWGLAILWLQLLGQNRLVCETLCHSLQTSRSVRAFYRQMRSLFLPETLRTMLELTIHQLRDVHAFGLEQCP
jgi:hypothetical protein